VIQQTNAAHVGLVFSPDGNTLYAAGGNDDAVYVYNKSGGTFITPATQIALGHFPPGASGSARNRRLSGRPGPRRLASRHGLCGRSVCEAGRGVSTRFGQVNALRSIEDILGTPHTNLNTAFQRPMADVFDITSSGSWTDKAVASSATKIGHALERRHFKTN
jgi:hypothetical protein